MHLRMRKSHDEGGICFFYIIIVVFFICIKYTILFLNLSFLFLKRILIAILYS